MSALEFPSAPVAADTTRAEHPPTTTLRRVAVPHVPLRWQLIGGFGLILIVLSFAGFWTAHVLNEQDDAYTGLVDGSATEALLAEQLRAELLVQAESVKDVLLRGDSADSFAKYSARFDASTVTLRELRARMDALPSLTPDERALLQQFDTNWASYVDAWPKAKAAYQAGRVQDADTLMRGRYPAASAALDSLALKVESRNRTEAARLAAHTDDVTGVILPLLGFVTLLGLSVALIITRTVTREVGGAAQDLLTSSEEILGAMAQQSAGAGRQSAVVAQTAAAIRQMKEASEHVSERAVAIFRSAEDQNKAAGRDLTAVRAALASVAGMAERAALVERQITFLAGCCERLEAMLLHMDQRAGQHGMLALALATQDGGRPDGRDQLPALAAELSRLAANATATVDQVRPALAEMQQVLPPAGRQMVTEGADADTRVAVIAQTVSDLAADLGLAVRSAHEIAEASVQHAAVAEQVAGAMAEVRQAAAQNVAATVKAQQTASHLNVLARRLRALIGGQAD